MPRMSRTGLILILAGLAVGVGAGLYIGWVAAPVRYVNTEPASLQRAFKDDYVLMIATAYAGDHDLQSARTQLAGLGYNNPAAAVSDAAQRLAATGLPDADQQRLAALAQALGAPANATATATASPTP
jgi:nucleoid-associated protein YgaU